MVKKGPKPRGKVKIEWSPDFAYAIGLLVTDGCIYRDGRHVNLTSKDPEQILHFKIALGLRNKITKKARGQEYEKKYYVIQFGSVLFVEFLESIGIGPAKSKTIGSVKVPDEYFCDFLRGCFDGDGSFYSYRDTRWRLSYMFYVSFASASRSFIDWLQARIHDLIGVRGHVTTNKAVTFWQLKYAKIEGEKIVRSMYYSDFALYLTRKRLKINKVFAMIGLAKV